jgi:hypothetical protein
VQTRECAEQRVAQEPADAEFVVPGPCQRFHGASVAAERVREHRTDRLIGLPVEDRAVKPLPVTG